MFDFKAQRVCIVGGSSGIGKEMARAFMELGADVTIASRNESKLDAAAEAIGTNVRTSVIDITNDESVSKFFADHESFHHVAISAAQTQTGSVRALSLSDARSAMDSKFWGAYRVGRAAKIVDGGSLTFVSGFLSERPSKTAVLQGAINAALEALARGLAMELAPVRVNAVSPGLIATEMYAKMGPAARDHLYEVTAKSLPVGRVGRPEDIAKAVIFLASNGYATGSTVLVDGGGVIA